MLGSLFVLVPVAMSTADAAENGSSGTDSGKHGVGYERRRGPSKGDGGEIARQKQACGMAERAPGCLGQALAQRLAPPCSGFVPGFATISRAILFA